MATSKDQWIDQIEDHMTRGTPYGRAYAKLVRVLTRIADARARRCGRRVRSAADIDYAALICANWRERVSRIGTSAASARALVSSDNPGDG